MNKRIIIQDLISDTGQVGNVTVIGDDTPGPTPTGTIPITENGHYNVAEFAEAEVEVAGGSQLPTDGTVTISCGSKTFSGDVHINLPNNNITLNSAFTDATLPNGGTIKITAKKITGMLQFAYSANVETIVIDTEESAVLPERFATKAKYILGTPLTIPSNGASGGYGYYMFRIVEIRFVENTAGGNIVFGSAMGGGASLSESSLVSIANALQAASGLTLTLYHQTVKNRCAAIMGYVENVTTNGDTYDRFVQDENGDTTLMEFITNVKGWTLA